MRDIAVMVDADNDDAVPSAQRAHDLEPLTEDECWSLLAGNQLGRLAIVRDGFPEVFPLGYDVTERDGKRVIVFRTRADNTIERHGAAVCFQSDGIDSGGSAHWTVIAKGYLKPGGSVEHDRHSAPSGHDAWKTIVVASVTGRRLRTNPAEWAFNPQAYL